MADLDIVEFKHGTIDGYDDRSGLGFILPDETNVNERLMLHRKSLRHREILLQVGDRVIYRTEFQPRGLVAIDVHSETPDSGELTSNPDLLFGTVVRIRADKKFGFIDTSTKKNIFFHYSQLSNSKVNICPGIMVSFRLLQKDTGTQAYEISLVPDTEVEKILGGNNRQANEIQDFLPQAILARDNRNFEEAVKLYERGLVESPTVQLVTSYAAMEKNRNRKEAAVRVYEKGIKIFGQSVKLCEDAGLLAASLGDHRRALELLQKGIKLCEDFNQAGKGRLLLGMARAYSKLGTHSDLKQSLHYFQLAQKTIELGGFGKSTFPKDDLLAMNMAAVRVQHYRGNLACDFLQKVGFRIIRAELFDNATMGCDLVVETNSSELVESYGISGSMLVRCMFKSDINRSDLEDLDKRILVWNDGGLVDEQVSILLVASLPDNLQNTLFRRIEEKGRAGSAIVPLTQSEIETAKGPMATLRMVLDQWLYRRDLFALNSPVSGRRFFGRDRPLADIRDAISNGTASGIFGLRKVGKTSLLKEIDRRSTDAGDIVIYMDLLRVPADIKDTRWLYWKLGAELHDRVSKTGLRGIRWRLGGVHSDYLDVPESFPVATAFDSDLTQVLNAIKKTNLTPRPKVVLMLDEIERIVPNTLGKEGFTGFFDFFSYIRGVAQESDDFVPLITGANAAIAEKAQFGGRDNPVFNFFREIYLPLLRTSESTKMVQTLGRGMGVRFSVEVCDFISSLTGGHPFFTRHLCSFISERFSERPLTVTIKMVTGLIEQYLEYAGRDFQEIMDRFSRDYPEERDACIAIVQNGGEIKLSELISASGSKVNLRHLLGYQIVQVRDDMVSLTIDLLRRWLLRMTVTDGDEGEINER